MKIQQHPRMKDIQVGDEVMCYRNHLYARVEEVFPAAVCVKIALLRSIDGHPVMTYVPQLWRADEIENLSVCHYCGSRADLSIEQSTGAPFRVCSTCRSVLEAASVTSALAPLERRNH
ncbi:hypothetical protein [Kallotenue papyrolyticum]|uniref:hypothetical protein n=1 Tax=Kallotenue papyrolyticum TaxID=1325125 RepID=UPI000492E0E8|nr:hypothetical protein [Kallotenue papyrolyticum]